MSEDEPRTVFIMGVRGGRSGISVILGRLGFLCTWWLVVAAFSQKSVAYTSCKTFAVLCPLHLRPRPFSLLARPFALSRLVFPFPRIISRAMVGWLRVFVKGGKRWNSKRRKNCIKGSDDVRAARV